MDDNTEQQAWAHQQELEHQEQEEIQNKDKGCQEFLNKLEKGDV